MAELLFEIGTEELPADFVDKALAYMETALVKQCADQRLLCTVSRVDGTPRRLVIIADIADKQSDLEEEITGPLWSVAFNADGTPTPAGEGFLKKNNLAPGDVKPKDGGKKGTVICGVRQEAGKATSEVLPALLEALMPRIPFKKTMRWGDRAKTNGQVFGRPVRWLLVLFAGKPLSVRFADVVSGTTTRGHRYHAPDEVVVDSVASYLKTLAGAQVVLSRTERADIIRAQAQALATAEGGVLVPDEPLVQLVKNLVEKPFPLLGRFDKAFLEVPKELLISEAREHQKYFMITDKAGDLLPCFVVVAGSDSKNKAALAAGNARVIRARFEDGAFYFRTDRERTLNDRVIDLDKLVFHKALGHYGEKATRLEAVGKAVVDFTATVLNANGDANAIGVDVARAAKLAKADLTSGVVNEFPELQGVMGRYYARLDGENDTVAFAIEDHYAPRHNGAALPRSDVGAIVGIADRLDTLVGIVGVVGVPSGSADPFALRRAAVALLTIAIERGYTFALKDVVGAAIAAYVRQGRLAKVEASVLISQVVDFIQGRLKGVLVEKAAAAGFADVSDVVDAALGARGGLDDLPDVWQRVLAVASLRSQDPAAFLALAATFKRVGNIVRKAREDGHVFGAAVPPEETLELPVERELAQAAVTLVATGSHTDTLRQVAALRPAVDRFFVDVMVMVDNAPLRTARLSLLAAIEGRLLDVADFTRLQA